MPPGTREYTKIAFEVTDHVAHIGLADEERLNCISYGLTADLLAATAEISERSDVEVVVLTANGNAFSAGYDLDVALSGDVEKMSRLRERHRKLCLWFRNVPIPVIACAQGPTVAAGASLFLTADIKIAAHDMEMWWPEIEHGMAAFERTAQFTREIGASKTAEIMLLGKHGKISADEARQLGFVNRVTSAGEHKRVATEMAETIVGYGENKLVEEYLKVIYRSRPEPQGTGSEYASWRENFSS